MSRPRAAIVSFRLGGADGVSVEAAKLGWALGELGFAVTTVAGEGVADRIVPGLGAGRSLAGVEAPPVDAGCVAAALAEADLVVVENLLSLPLNPAAAAAVAGVLAGRRAVIRHFDLPWERPRFAGYPPPADDPAWIHVTITDRSRQELAARGIAATTIPNAFDPHPPVGDRDGVRRALGLATGDWLVLQPTRAIPRKDVPAGLALAEAVGATFWLLGPAEEGYGPDLEQLLAEATVPVHHGPLGPVTASSGVEHAYAACDVVVFPSQQEGFGNPPIEAALHRRPVAVGPYRTGRELVEEFGFEWFAADDPAAVAAFVRSGETGLLDHNGTIARRYFSLEGLPRSVSQLLVNAGWTW